MADPLRVTFFGEDSGHELAAHALVERIAAEKERELDLRTGCSRGGIPYALAGFKEYQQRVLLQRIIQPDVLVVVVDANTVGLRERVRELENLRDPRLSCRLVVGCPDPYVERWCLCQPAAFKAALGAVPLPQQPRHAGRNGLKRLLVESVHAAGATVLTTPMEVAPDIVEHLDLTSGATARKRWPDLIHFTDGLRRAFQA